METGRVTVPDRDAVNRLGLGTVAYHPAASEASHVAYETDLHVLETGTIYRLPAEIRQHCFMVSHFSHSPEFVGRPSYVGVAAWSVMRLPQRTPLSLYRNGSEGWWRDEADRVNWDPGGVFEHCDLSPRAVFSVHGNASNLRALDDGLGGIAWHGTFDRERGERSWDPLERRRLWDLREEEVAADLSGCLSESPSRPCRFDGKLIRFKLTGSRGSPNGPNFCINGHSRMATDIWLFGRHFEGSRFRFVFQ